MRRITVLVDGSIKTVNFYKALVVDGVSLTLITKRATIFWDYDNISPVSGNNVITFDGTVLTLDSGFYTYNDLTDYLKQNGVIIKRFAWNDTCMMSSPAKSMKLGKMARLIGFEESDVFSMSAKIGIKPIDINNGLRYVNISCNLVNSEENFYSGARSNIVASLPVGVVAKGKVQTYHDMESVVPINRGTFNQIRLDVTDQDQRPVNVGSILLEMYVS